jgi:hypothetical protein
MIMAGWPVCWPMIRREWDLNDKRSVLDWLERIATFCCIAQHSVAVAMHDGGHWRVM